MSIPGVGLDETRRRMTASHQRLKIREKSTPFLSHDHNSSYSTLLDPSTSEARNRLEQRLGYSAKPFRRFGRDGDGGKIWVTSRRFGMVKRMFFRGLWRFRSGGSEQICAVCLDKCYGDVEMVVLKCSHKYHSKCILPWLEAHSNCPYCRNPI